MSLGPFLLGKRLHYVTFMMVVTWTQFATINDHCGYDFPWSPKGILPFSTDSDYHNYHHSHGNNGNFSGNFSIWDTVLGTNVKFFEEI